MQSSCIPTGACDPAPPSPPPPYTRACHQPFVAVVVFMGCSSKRSAIPSTRAWCKGSWAQNSGRAQETVLAMTGWAGLFPVSNWLALRVVPKKGQGIKGVLDWQPTKKYIVCPPKPRKIMENMWKWDLPPEWLWVTAYGRLTSSIPTPSTGVGAWYR